MPDWQERITRETEPAIRAEHYLRYRLVRELILSSGVWADLGCGAGLAAADVLGDKFSGHAVLVDRDPEVTQGAQREVRAGSVAALAEDLSDPEALERVREAILQTGGERVVTCFEVIEHLPDFTALIRLLVELSESDEATVVMSVPNDAFYSIENPHHRSMWGEGSFAELLTLLPERRTVARQLSLHGSALILDGNPDPPKTPEIELASEIDAPTHFIVSIGPHAGELAPAAEVVPTSMLAQRQWERQRENDNAYLEVALERVREEARTLQAENEKLTRLVRENTRQFDDWRVYILELEGRLGLPPSGTSERAAFDAGASPPPPGELPAGDPAEEPGP